MSFFLRFSWAIGLARKHCFFFFSKENSRNFQKFLKFPPVVGCTAVRLASILRAICRAFIVRASGRASFRASTCIQFDNKILPEGNNFHHSYSQGNINFSRISFINPQKPEIPAKRTHLTPNYPSLVSHLLKWTLEASYTPVRWDNLLAMLKISFLFWKLGELKKFSRIFM